MRSNFERRIAAQLDDAKVAYEYEEHDLVYFKKVRSGRCNGCESKDVVQKHIYRPDFWLPAQRFFIETKGIFDPSDRAKMKLMKEQHTDVEIRLVFQRDNFALKKKGVRYSDWCKQAGYQYAVGEIPKAWLS